MKITVNRVWLEQVHPATEEEEEDFDPNKVDPEEEYNLIKVKKTFLLRDIRSIEAPPPTWSQTYKNLGVQDVCQIYFYHDDPIAVEKPMKDMEKIWIDYLNEEEDKNKYGL